MCGGKTINAVQTSHQPQKATTEASLTMPELHMLAPTLT